MMTKLRNPWRLMALLIAITIIASCSDSDSGSDNGGNNGGSPVPTKSFNDLMTVLKEMEKKGEITSLTQGTNAFTKKPCASFYVMQPTDHNAKNWNRGKSESLRQKVSIVAYSGDNAPTILVTNGYAMVENDVNCYYPNVAQLLNGNVVEVEHRYCGTSLPLSESDWDWYYNNAIQQSADLNAIITLLKSKGMFNGKWVATGTSKSGMTTTFLAMHHPEACDLYLAFCAPFCESLSDTRCASYLFQTCYKDHPQSVKDLWERNWQFLEDLLQNKPVLQEVLKLNLEYLAKSDPTYAKYTEDQNLSTLINTFYISQFGKAMYFHVSDWAKYIPDNPKDYVPGDTKEDKDYLDYLRRYCYIDNDSLAKWGITTNIDKTTQGRSTAMRARSIVGDVGESNSMTVMPYLMQCVLELGTYQMDFSRVKPYLTDKQYTTLLTESDVMSKPPYALYRSQFKAITPSVKQFLKTAKSKMIFVYGENDPFTGAGITAEDISGNPNVKLFLVPDGVHDNNFLEANYSSDPSIGLAISQAIKEGIQ